MAEVPQSETNFQTTVIDLAKTLGWRVLHFRGVRVQRKDGSTYYQTPVGADGAGFPDLVLAKTGHPIYFVKLKSQSGKLSATQEEWRKVLDRSSSPYLVLRPSDWDMVVKILSPQVRQVSG